MAPPLRLRPLPFRVFGLPAGVASFNQSRPRLSNSLDAGNLRSRAKEFTENSTDGKIMASEQQQQRSESVQRQSSLALIDESSNESSGSRVSSGSVDIETNGSADEAALPPIIPPISNATVMSVADSLSPAKHQQPPAVYQHENSPSSSSSSAGNNHKLAHQHVTSHLYTIEAILGLNNQHAKGKYIIYTSIRLYT